MKRFDGPNFVLGSARMRAQMAHRWAVSVRRTQFVRERATVRHLVPRVTLGLANFHDRWIVEYGSGE
jgi:hypothetical protein